MITATVHVAVVEKKLKNTQMKSAIDHGCLYQITRKVWKLPSGVKPKSIVFDFSS